MILDVCEPHFIQAITACPNSVVQRKDLDVCVTRYILQSAVQDMNDYLCSPSVSKPTISLCRTDAARVSVRESLQSLALDRCQFADDVTSVRKFDMVSLAVDEDLVVLDDVNWSAIRFFICRPDQDVIWYTFVGVGRQARRLIFCGVVVILEVKMIAPIFGLSHHVFHFFLRQVSERDSVQSCLCSNTAAFATDRTRLSIWCVDTVLLAVMLRLILCAVDYGADTRRIMIANT